MASIGPSSESVNILEKASSKKKNPPPTTTKASSTNDPAAVATSLIAHERNPISIEEAEAEEVLLLDRHNVEDLEHEMVESVSCLLDKGKIRSPNKANIEIRPERLLLVPQEKRHLYLFRRLPSCHKGDTIFPVETAAPTLLVSPSCPLPWVT